MIVNETILRANDPKKSFKTITIYVVGVNVFAMGVAKARACELEIVTGKGNTMAYGLGDFQNFDRFATAVKEIAQENASKCA